MTRDKLVSAADITRAVNSLRGDMENIRVKAEQLLLGKDITVTAGYHTGQTFKVDAISVAASTHVTNVVLFGKTRRGTQVIANFGRDVELLEDEL